MRYHHESLKKAASHCVEELRRDGGIGGVIALDSKGHGELKYSSGTPRRGVFHMLTVSVSKLRCPSIALECTEASLEQTVHRRQQYLMMTSWIELQRATPAPVVCSVLSISLLPGIPTIHYGIETTRALSCLNRYACIRLCKSGDK